ncbi:MAG: preprotein translocase subunit SecE [Candidatus Gracilibacteria bacterium]|nr:preprotein translocase subunit SecE [Candidatus Gracilibacteria bacterium]MDD5178876.1 preprotein translocase subunit SecE [Candidatus Gracilibacteria bacterium]
MNILLRYIRDAVSELHRVTWPTRAQAVRISLIVLGVTLFFAFALGFLDTFLAAGYKLLLSFADSSKT